MYFENECDRKDYRVSVKIRNNLIIKAIEESGGQPGQKWCEKNGLSYSVISEFISMKRSPLNESGELITQAKKLCDALNKLPEELWNNQQLYPLEKNFSEMEMTHSQILQLTNQGGGFYIESFNDLNSSQTKKLIDNALSTLTEKEQHVIKLRFEEEMTYEQASHVMKVTRERIRQIEAKALRKLRHPSRVGMIIDAVDFKDMKQEEINDIKFRTKQFLLNNTENDRR